MPLYSVVVPCYNEEGNIKALVERFVGIAGSFDFELILVDNGSKDNTGKAIDSEMRNYSFVRKTIVEVNRGYGFGILSGLKDAKGRYLGWIHADLQSEPEVFSEMFESAVNEKSSFLYKGARSGRSMADLLFTKGMGIYESLLFGMKMYDVNSQPTLLDRDYFESWNNAPHDFSLDLFAYVLALKKGITVNRFESPQHSRLSGESTWNINWASRVKMVKRVINYSKETKRRICQ